VNSRRFALTLALTLFAALTLPAHAQVDKSTANAIEGYFDFVDYNSGTLMAEQIPADDYRKLFVLDVRDAGQFAKDHIPGAVNIEWRKVFAERGKLPKDRTILVYCNTSSFSGQVAMALRMDGFENVRILHGGYGEWKARGGLEAYARAAKKS
jgi:rhodanese-related sulfurtransferase